MKTFEKLGLSKFEDYKLNKVMTAKIIGGEQCTGGGFRLLDTDSKRVGHNMVYTNVYESWSSDTSDGCGNVKYHDLKVEPHEYSLPIA